MRFQEDYAFLILYEIHKTENTKIQRCKRYGRNIVQQKM